MLDIILLVLLLVGFGWGCMKGFLAQLVSLLGAVAGFLVACMLYGAVGDFLAPEIGTSPTMGLIIAFFLIWVCVPLLFTLVTKVVAGILKTIKLGWINSLLGGAFGALKILLFLSVILSFMEFVDKYKSDPFISMETKDSSLLYYPVQKAAGKLLPSDFLERTTSDPQENGAA